MWSMLLGWSSSELQSCKWIQKERKASIWHHLCTTQIQRHYRDKQCEDKLRLSWGLLFLPRASLGLPTAFVADRASPPPTGLEQAFLLLLCWQELLPDLFSLLCLHYMSPQQHPGIVVGIELAQRFKGGECRKRCLCSLLLKGISVSHPSLGTLSKGRDRIVLLRQEKSKPKPLFLYLLVWRNLLIIVATAAASSAFRWMARQLLQSVFFLNLVSQELKINLVSSWLNIPSGLLVQQGYSFCGVITYHLTSLPAQGKAWSSCNERQAGEKMETKQNPWIKTFCSFCVPHREMSQWPNFSFAFNFLAVVKKAWQRQGHNYLLKKKNKVGRQFYCPILPKCWSTSLLPYTINTGEREEEEEGGNAEEEKNGSKRNASHNQ